MDKKYSTKLIQRIYDNLPCNSESEKAEVMARIFDVENEVNFSENGLYRTADIVSVIETVLSFFEARYIFRQGQFPFLESPDIHRRIYPRFYG